MMRFDFYLPTRLLFGPGCLKAIGCTPYLPAGSRALIVVAADGAMLHDGYLPRVQGLLSDRGVATMVHDRITTPLESAQIDTAAACVRESEADFIVGLGGDGAIDTAKGTAFLAGTGGRCWDHAAGGGDTKIPSPASLPWRP